ncbi:hypothetical protein Dsin_008794 [Dipteronia sinensis]|uniref:Uncharacterized protein n=1 Tax=Dipteronia sinensis TaxID=43782 RepID=A0AAE0EBA2_9ROSI|nr:hypothetical protein Dsin_008794 [Dipteronia sinensis]
MKEVVALSSSIEEGGRMKEVAALSSSNEGGRMKESTEGEENKGNEGEEDKGSFILSLCKRILMSSYDGLIRLMDAEKEVFDLVYSSGYSIFSLSQQPNNVNSIYFGEVCGGLTSWDVRAGKSSSEWLLHESRIHTIDFNSQNPHIMATSSSDATACLWDLRSVA